MTSSTNWPAAATSSSRRAIAVRPPSSSTTFASALVTVNGLPTGRQPCDTSVRTGISAGSTTPTAPLRMTRSSNTRRFVPTIVPADARPPITQRPGTRVLQSASRSATGNENGSASKSTVASAAMSAGQPSTRTPPASGRASSANPLTRPPPQSAAHTLSAGSSSTSRDPPAIDTAVAPMSTSGSSSARRPSAMSENASTWWRDTKNTIRSGRSPSSCSSSSPTTAPTASNATGCTESAAA